MLLSETEGWPDIVRVHPSVMKLLLLFVAPMSAIPPLMHAYAQLVHPGAVTLLVQPPLTAGELLLVGGAFYITEIAMVSLMAVYIQQLAESFDLHPKYEETYTLAAIAPTPLWLSSLALFVPNVWFNVAVVLVAWVGSVALIRHGVRPLFRVEDEITAHRLANAVTVAGVGVWIGLMVVLTMSLGMLMGWR
jgi:hypothetical protein